MNSSKVDKGRDLKCNPRGTRFFVLLTRHFGPNRAFFSCEYKADHVNLICFVLTSEEGPIAAEMSRYTAVHATKYGAACTLIDTVHTTTTIHCTFSASL